MIYSLITLPIASLFGDFSFEGSVNSGNQSPTDITNQRSGIESFGYVEPIEWNERTGNMVGGHQRYKIMVNEPGLTELTVSVVDLGDQQEKLLNLALKRFLADGIIKPFIDCLMIYRLVEQIGNCIMNDKKPAEDFAGFLYAIFAN